jgi:hypothetical protein
MFRKPPNGGSSIVPKIDITDSLSVTAKLVIKREKTLYTLIQRLFTEL